MNDIIKILSCLVGSNCLVSTPNAFYIGKNGYTSPTKQIQDLSTKVDGLSDSINTVQNNLDTEIQTIDNQLLSIQRDMSTMSLNITKVSQATDLNKQNINTNTQSINTISSDINSILTTLNSNTLIGRLNVDSQGYISISSITKSGIYEVYNQGKTQVFGHIICDYKHTSARSFLLIGDLQVDSTKTKISGGGDVWSLIYLYTEADTIKVINFTQDIPSINKKVAYLDTKVQQMDQTIFNHYDEMDSRIGDYEAYNRIIVDEGQKITPYLFKRGTNIIVFHNVCTAVVIATGQIANKEYPTSFLLMGNADFLDNGTYDSSQIVYKSDKHNIFYIYEYDDSVIKTDLSIMNTPFYIKSNQSTLFQLSNIPVGIEIPIYDEHSTYLGNIKKYDDENIFINGFIDINIFTSSGISITKSEIFNTELKNIGG